MMRRVKLTIAGRVQGVFFRKATKQKADELGVIGTVRNLDDGQVEVIAQADPAILAEFMDWCHQGPLLARVDEIAQIELEINPLQFSSFEII
jgi:acylphosphatase